jgi:hypothetical protein
MPENRRKKQRRRKVLRQIERRRQFQRVNEILLRSAFGVEWKKYRQRGIAVP